MAKKAVLASVLSWLACGGSRHASGVTYYAGWGSYNLPVHPQHEISELKARSSRVYYKAVYDARGLLIVFEKFGNDGASWRHDYEYDKEGDPVRATISEPGREPVVREL